ncbi:MAG: DUF2461 domain-containing protein [Chitinophagaceae bacterium]
MQIAPETLLFLTNLKENNHKPWFDANRKQYEVAKGNFLAFTAAILKQFALIDAGISHLQPKDCVFRINRDVRFSKNKEPYKTNMGLSISAGGKKGNMAGYYFHLEPNGACFAGGGLYMPMPAEVQKVRQEIDYCSDEFLNIINNNTFKQHYGNIDLDANLSLSKAPKGYDANHPLLPYLKLKSWIATASINDEAILSNNFLMQLIEKWEALMPLIYFLNRAIV